ncbi:hypothetical protein KAFR_0A01540 [Kazachstania africana CBS 2517]|uniref:EH domain-containing protein n=1 Tax=Kazachstania africana (strain ATCC 22294 / BCRC 22015 / CBS 2517 / CECT 1963 / NBRC 1671 / NRRL Y-8276) TaxID=1071382 RepID=H2AMJ2_KAZAF|nr:hypothetical protein KAFR_0A01540 [Kazachstania africana CBS 2517]CCF55592.1 hypothetical protein KAFR_0A01540 [Kazachstania africana CBS 2517]
MALGNTSKKKTRNQALLNEKDQFDSLRAAQAIFQRHNNNSRSTKNQLTSEHSNYKLASQPISLKKTVRDSISQKTSRRPNPSRSPILLDRQRLLHSSSPIIHNTSVNLNHASASESDIASIAAALAHSHIADHESKLKSVFEQNSPDVTSISSMQTEETPQPSEILSNLSLLENSNDNKMISLGTPNNNDIHDEGNKDGPVLRPVPFAVGIERTGPTRKRPPPPPNIFQEAQVFSDPSEFLHEEQLENMSLRSLSSSSTSSSSASSPASSSSSSSSSSYSTASESLIPTEPTATLVVRESPTLSPTFSNQSSDDSTYMFDNELQKGYKKKKKKKKSKRYKVKSLTHKFFRNNVVYNEGDIEDSSTTSNPVKFRTTMRHDYEIKRKFNEDKPWKKHRSVMYLSDAERKRYEGMWIVNRFTYLNLLPWWPQNTDDEKEVEENTGRTLNLPEEGLILNQIVMDIWNRSNLPSTLLTRIYDLVDLRKDGTLNRKSFILGMWLVDQCLYGRKLPEYISQPLWDSVDNNMMNIIQEKTYNELYSKQKKKNVRSKLVRRELKHLSSGIKHVSSHL